MSNSNKLLTPIGYERKLKQWLDFAAQPDNKGYPSDPKAPPDHYNGGVVDLAEMFRQLIEVPQPLPPKTEGDAEPESDNEDDDDNDKKQTFHLLRGWRVANNDTPRALFRLLYLVEPVQPLDFSDMYKTHLLNFSSPAVVINKATGETCSDFMVSIYLQKYELEIWLWTRRPETHQGKKVIFPIDDHLERGHEFKSKTAARFWEMLMKAVEMEWVVYDGNDFVV